MMRDLLADRRGVLRRAAVLDGGELTDLCIDRDDRPALMGAVLLGRVARLASGLNAAFVEIGQPQPGLLNAADVRPLPPRGRGELKIGQLLRTGDAVLVQVKADPHRDKGALLTMDVSLPGRFLVHLPLDSGLHLSRRMGRGPEKARIQALLRQAVSAGGPGQGGGWIVRAEAACAPPELLLAEAEALAGRAADMARARQGAAAPARLLPPPDPVARAIIELGGAGFGAVRVEGADLLVAVKGWCRRHAPDLLDRITPHVGAHPLFATADLDGAIAALLDRRVPLSQGGSLVIEPTEALTVVDVNGGERGNALSTNLEACGEIARQLRLRNVGGIVVVDFLNLARADEREQLIQRLSHAVSDDPAGTHVYGMSKLGLVELTRARRGPPLAALLSDTASLDL